MATAQICSDVALVALRYRDIAATDPCLSKISFQYTGSSEFEFATGALVSLPSWSDSAILVADFDRHDTCCNSRHKRRAP
jgi:hypothetical protein